MERHSQRLNQVLAVSSRALTNSHHSLVTVHRYSSFSPVRLDSSRESSLPMMNSLSPEWTQSLDTSSIGTSYLLNDSASGATALYSREDDAGILILPDDAPRGPRSSTDGSFLS